MRRIRVSIEITSGGRPVWESIRFTLPDAEEARRVVRVRNRSVGDLKKTARRLRRS